MEGAVKGFPFSFLPAVVLFLLWSWLAFFASSISWEMEQGYGHFDLFFLFAYPLHILLKSTKILFMHQTTDKQFSAYLVGVSVTRKPLRLPTGREKW